MKDFLITLDWLVIRETSLNEVTDMLPYLISTMDTDGDLLIGWNPIEDSLVLYNPLDGYFDGYQTEICSKQIDPINLEGLKAFLPYVKNMQGVTLEYLEKE